jgi:hypothetical protein
VNLQYILFDQFEILSDFSVDDPLYVVGVVQWLSSIIVDDSESQFESYFIQIYLVAGCICIYDELCIDVWVVSQYQLLTSLGSIG